jgi:hypothetical protein
MDYKNRMIFVKRFLSRFPGSEKPLAVETDRNLKLFARFADDDIKMGRGLRKSRSLVGSNSLRTRKCNTFPSESESESIPILFVGNSLNPLGTSSKIFIQPQFSGS